MTTPQPALDWPLLSTLYRLLLALTLGLFVGLEREWRGKEAGLRTFGFAALLGAMGAILGESYALVCLALLGVLIVLLNIQSLKSDEGIELTTSAALLITGMSGIFCGMGHTLTAASVIVVVAWLLVWKERLAGFSHSLTAEEIRSAILLAILTFVVYPLLPASPVDPWSIIVPREIWIAIILVAGIGFVNYLLWKILGNKGIALTGFLGGLVNSSIAVAEIAACADVSESLDDEVYQGVLLATSAMALRNALILALLAGRALEDSIAPLAFIVAASWALARRKPIKVHDSRGPALSLPLKSPLSPASVAMFGSIFVALEIAGGAAQILLGRWGFYATSVVGGLISSASAVASSAGLFSSGRISAQAAGLGAVLASLSSAGVNLAFVAKFSQSRRLVWRLARALGIVLALAASGAYLASRLPWLSR
ncbi:MAG: MgtC/SapB family protein [Elusimicrobiota bacterium]